MSEENVAPVSTPGQITPSGLNQTETQPEQEQGVNPLLDRSVPTDNLTDAHLEPTEDPEEDSVLELEETDSSSDEPPATLAEMVGSELMNDPGCSLVARGLDRLCKGKVDHNRAFGNAIENDDPRFIDEAYLREVLGDDADEAIQSAKFLLDYADTYTADLQQRLYASVEGGEEALKVAAKHFNTTATPADKKLVATLLDSGNMEYMQHALQLITQGAKGVMPKHRAQTFGSPTGLQPISRADFGKAVIDNPNMSPSDYEKLRERLAASFR